MSRSISHIPVIEWSPAGVRGFDPGSHTLVETETVAEALRLLGNPRQVGLALGRRQAFVRTVKLPDVSKADAINILRLQLDQHFPLAGPDLAFDFAPTGDSHGDGRANLVVACRVDVLREALAAVEAAGSSVMWCVPSAVASPALVRDLQVETGVVVEDTVDGLAMDVVENGRLVYSRVAPYTDHSDAVASEISRTLIAAKVDSAQTIAAGGFAYGAAKHTVTVPTIEILANHYDGELHLALPEVVEREARKQVQIRRRLAVLVCAAAVMTGFLVYMDRDDRNRAVARERAKWDRSLERLETNNGLLTTRLTETGGKAKLLEKALKPKQYLGDVATVVANSVPPGAWLTGIILDRGRPLQVRGTAKTNDDVAQFVANLSLSPRLRDVKLVFANNGTIADAPVVQFSITAHVVGNFPVIENAKGGGR